MSLPNLLTRLADSESPIDVVTDISALESRISELIEENDPEMLYDDAQWIVEQLSEQHPHLLQDNEEMYDRVMQMVADARWHTLWRQTPEVVDLLLTNHFEMIRDYKWESVLSDIRDVLQQEPDLAKRDEWKEKYRKHIKESQLWVGDQKMLLGGENADPTIANWFRDFNGFVGDRPADPLLVVEYLNSGSNSSLLNPETREQMEGLLKLYMELEASSETIEGSEDMLVIPDPETGHYFAAGRGEYADLGIEVPEDELTAVREAANMKADGTPLSVSEVVRKEVTGGRYAAPVAVGETEQVEEMRVEEMNEDEVAAPEVVESIVEEKAPEEVVEEVEETEEEIVEAPVVPEPPAPVMPEIEDISVAPMTNEEVTSMISAPLPSLPELDFEEVPEAPVSPEISEPESEPVMPVPEPPVVPEVPVPPVPQIPEVPSMPEAPAVTEMPEPVEAPAAADTTVQEEPELDYAQLAREVLAEVQILFPDFSTEKRFLSIVTSFLNGKRTEDEARDQLAMAPEEGGVHLEAREVDATIQAATQLKQQELDHPRAEAAMAAEGGDAFRPTLDMVERKLATERVASEEKKFREQSEQTEEDDGSNVVDIFAQMGSQTDMMMDAMRPAKSERQTSVLSRMDAVQEGKMEAAPISDSTMVMGPMEELQNMTLKEFRSYSQGNPDNGTKEIKEAIHLLGEESIQRKADGIQAWKQSPLNHLYVEIGNESFAQSKAVTEVIAEREQAGKETLTEQEFHAIADMNSHLRF